MKTSEYTFTSIFADEISAYLALRESQGHNARRERYYFLTLDQYLAAGVKGKALTPEIVEGWLQSLKMRVNNRIVCISHYTQFAKYLHSLGLTAFVPERPMSDRQYVPYIFSRLELERLFAAADSRFFERESADTKTSKLHFPLILRLLYGCGLRLNEALILRAEDVDLDNGVVLIRKAKGNKDRLIPMDSSLTEIFRQFFVVTGKATNPQALLFENRKGERRKPGWADGWFQWCLKEAGILKPELQRHSRNICPHCMRHTFAVDSLRKQDLAGVDMYTAAPMLSVYLGHVNFCGTQRYIHMSAENSADIVNKTNAYSKGLFPEAPK